MRIVLQKAIFKFLTVSIILANGCQSEINRNDNFIHKNNLSRKLTTITEDDTLNSSLISIDKRYEIEINGKLNNKNFEIKHDWMLDFAFIDIKNGSYFVPHSILPAGKINYPSKLKIQEDFSIELITEDDNSFYFDIEICYNFAKTKSHYKDKLKGITVTNKDLMFSDDIFEELSRKEGNTATSKLIKQQEFRNEMDICRKIRVKQQDNMVIFSEVNNNMEELLSEPFQQLTVIENGNILDTLVIDASVWNNYKRIYD